MLYEPLIECEVESLSSNLDGADLLAHHARIISFIS